MTVNIKKMVYSTVGLLLLCFIYCTDGISSGKDRKILVINSNSSVEKYRIVQNEFSKAVNFPIHEVNLAEIEKEKTDIKPLLSYNPDLIYCIGAKSYSFAKENFNGKDILISSTVNLQRLSLTSRTYGISNELHPKMPLLIFRSIFPSINKIGIVYSKEYTSQWYDSTKELASEMGIVIVGGIVSKDTDTESVLKQILPNIQALWLISDPIITPKLEILEKIFKLCNTNKKPIISYLDAFIEMGAALIVTVDDPTIGRQAADMAAELLLQEKFQEKIRYPAGSQVILNLKKVEELGIEYNQEGLGVVNSIIK